MTKLEDIQLIYTKFEHFFTGYKGPNSRTDILVRRGLFDPTEENLKNMEARRWRFKVAHAESLKEENVSKLPLRPSVLWDRVLLFTQTFERVLSNYLQKNHPESPGQTLRLEINGRSYWYGSYFNDHGVLLWDKIHWEDEQVDHTVL